MIMSRISAIVAVCCSTMFVAEAVAPRNYNCLNLPLAFSSITTQQKQQQQQKSNAFLSSSLLSKNVHDKPIMRTKMSYTNDGNNNNDLPPPSPLPRTEEMIRRLSIRGVSVSPNGFLVLLSTSTTSSENTQQVITIPLRVTNPLTMDNDSYAATSAEALTILQLLGNVDMAGTIFPPQILQHVAALHSALLTKHDDENEIIEVEDELGLLSKSITQSSTTNDEEYYNNVFTQMSAEELINKFVHQTLPSDITYDEANVWQRNKVKYPKVSLDEIRVELPLETESEWKEGVFSSLEHESTTTDDKEEGRIHPVPLKYVLVCTVDETSKLEIPLYSEQPNFSSYSQKIQTEIEKSHTIAEKSCYSYDVFTSNSFLMTCLALRYKCPIVVSSKVLDSFVDAQSLLDEKMQDLSSSEHTPKICLIYKQENGGNDVTNTDGTNDENISKRRQQLQKQKEEEAFISTALPSWKAANAIRKTSERVDRTVQRGFEENKLRGALRIAMEKGDDVAVQKIRNEIEKLRDLDDDEDDDDDIDEEEFEE